MPSSAIAPVATTSITRSSSQGERRPIPVSPTKVASAVKAPTVKTSPCENLMTSSTPKNSVKPTATSAYIMPSISPFMTYWANTPASMFETSPRRVRRWAGHPRLHPCRQDVDGRTSPAMTLSLIRELLLPRQLALAAGIFAIIPFHELAVLHHVRCDDRNGILAVIVKGNFADD